MVGFAIFYILTLSLCSYGLVTFYTRAFHCRKSRKLLLGKIVAAVALGTLSYGWQILSLGILYGLVLLQLSRLLAWLWKKLAGKGPRGTWTVVAKRVYQLGLIPWLVVLALFLWGSTNMSQVRQTTYSFTSDKLSRDYKVVFLSDVHFGTVQDPQVLMDAVEQINALEPNVVILGGDIVEDGTTLQQAEHCFYILSQLKSQYGTYFVYGNHDRQRYSANPSYGEQQLRSIIEGNGITILQDQYVPLGNELLLLGREDLSAGADRLEEDQLSTGERQRYLITADHQPAGVIENVRLMSDLLLTGHTHGGQIFPLGCFPSLFGGHVYGQYTEGLTEVVISSGFAGWGFPIRTQGHCEYVVVELSAGT